MTRPTRAPAACLLLLAHLPERLRHVRATDPPEVDFGDYRNAEATDALADEAVERLGPALAAIGEIVDAGGRVAASLSGPLLRHLERHGGLRAAFAPLLRAGDAVEQVAEPFDGSIRCVVPGDSPMRQLRRGADAVEKLTGRRPTTAANVGLIYDDSAASRAAAAGMTAVVCGHPDPFLDNRPPAAPLVHAATGTAVLARHGGLSDDLGVRLADPAWGCNPLSADAFADWTAAAAGDAGTVLITLHLSDLVDVPGLADLLRRLPAALEKRGVGLALPRESVGRADATPLSVPRATSAVGPRRDLSPWLGNAMQSNAVTLLLRAAERFDDADPRLLTLSAADHLAHARHRNFASIDPVLAAALSRQSRSPYGSPYDAYLDHANAMRHLLASPA